MFCTACGARLPAWARFCSGCGAAVAAPPATRPASPTLSDAQTLAPSVASPSQPADLTLTGTQTQALSHTLSGAATISREPLAVWLGRELGGYKLEQLCGSGPLGAVFQARRLGDGPRVAVKLLRPWLANDTALIDEHLQTLHLLNLLEHPHLLPVSESFRRAGIYAIVTPWAEGGSLSGLLARRGKLSEPQAVGLLTQAVRGLLAAAESGLHHGNLKPSNLLFDTAGRLMLTDFSLATAELSEATTAGVGSLRAHAYRAPEQWHDTRLADSRSDQYALGCLLFLMLTGAPPFSGPGRVQLLRQHCAEPAPRLREQCPAVSTELETLAARLLAKEPSARFADLAALAEALARLPSWQPALARRLSFELPAAEAAPQAVRVFPQAGETWQRIPAGGFTRCCAEAGNEPLRVELARPFLLRAMPLSQRDWLELMGTPCARVAQPGDRLPATGISWWQALDACNRLSEREGLAPFYQLADRRMQVLGGTGYRLPSEDEWELACRAGSDTPYWHGAQLLPSQACFDTSYPLPGLRRTDSPTAPAPVASFAPNPWGLFGLHGGVWEWCAERFGRRPLRVARGGSWGTPAGQCHASFRGRFHPASQLPTLGLRPARWEEA